MPNKKSPLSIMIAALGVVAVFALLAMLIGQAEYLAAFGLVGQVWYVVVVFLAKWKTFTKKSW